MENINSIQLIEDLPDNPFWIVVWDDSLTIPGDERSRTHPGHGYPESTRRFIRVGAFTNREELKTEVKKLLFPSVGPPKKFRVFGAEELTVTPSVELSFD